MSAPRSSGRTTSGVENVASTHDQRAGGVRGGGERGEVGHGHQRVGHRLEPHQVGAVERGHDGVGVADVDAAHGHPAQSLLRARRSTPCRSTPAAGTTATVPAGRPSTTAAIAAMPLAKASAVPPSSSPSTPSKAATVGGDVVAGVAVVVAVVPVGRGEHDRRVQRAARARPGGPAATTTDSGCSFSSTAPR